MKKSIILIFSLSLIFISGCKNETEKAEEIDTSQDKAVVQTQAPAGTPETQEAKEEKPPQEVFITIQEGKFEPKAFELKAFEKVIFRIKSLDVEHTFTIPSLKINETVPAGEEIVFETVPDSGEPFIHFHCDIHGMFLESGTITMK